MFQEFSSPPKLYLPAVAILGLVLVLLGFIGVSTYRNLNTNRQNALTFVHRQGVGLLNVVEAGARAGLLSPMWEADAIARLIVETGKNDDIAYIYLVNREGRIEHHSNPELNGAEADWRPWIEDREEFIGRLRTKENGTAIYEVAKRFSPMSPSVWAMQMKMGRIHHQMPAIHLHRDSVLVIGLRMTTFEAARKADLHHAGVMAGILAALAAGTIFFLFVIRKYYRTNTALKETQDYTRQVIASMANGLLSTDENGNILTYNRLALTLLGFPEAEIEQRKLSEIIDLDRHGLDKTIQECGSMIDRDVIHQRPDGTAVPVALSLTPIPGKKEKCAGTVVIIRDLTRIKQLEETVRRTEKLAALGALAAAVAHEIRNPLSSIRGFAQFLSHALENRPKDREYARIMVKEVDRINRVVTDLLTFARPMETMPESTDLSELIDHIIRLTRADAASAGINILKNVSPDLGKARVDPNQITQVLLNLTLNALQESRQGQTLEIGADGARDHFRIWVTDEGPGVPADRREKIFDPFFTTREKGTGLGLAIVRKIVENHGGDIRVESPPAGKTAGCRFVLRLPNPPETGEPPP